MKSLLIKYLEMIALKSMWIFLMKYFYSEMDEYQHNILFLFFFGLQNSWFSKCQNRSLISLHIHLSVEQPAQFPDLIILIGLGLEVAEVNWAIY